MRSISCVSGEWGDRRVNDSGRALGMRSVDRIKNLDRITWLVVHLRAAFVEVPETRSVLDGRSLFKILNENLSCNDQDKFSPKSLNP